MAFAKTNTINTQAPIAYNGGFISNLKRFMNKRKAISQLNAMSDRQLEDIGLVRGHIEAAVNGEMYR